MKKKVKYEMYVNMRSIYGPVVPISKKQYDAFLKGYKKAIAENHEQEPPERYNDMSGSYEENEDYADDMSVAIIDHETYTQTKHIISNTHEFGCIVLNRYETKDGFFWK